MQKLFTKILVPVAFNRNTRWSVDKAIQLANRFECDILLLHVENPSSGIPFFPSAIPFFDKAFFPRSDTRPPQDDLVAKMNTLKRGCRYKLKEGLQVDSVFRVGHWQSILKDVIIAEHIDLALIPRSRRRFSSVILRRININKLSQQTNCPVMTITRNFNVNHLHNIVVPVHELLPVKKLMMATYLSLETSGCIYLMGTDGRDMSKSGKDYLIRAYQLLNGVGKLTVHCALRDKADVSAGTLAYARDVHANLIVVHPGQESRLKGWWNNLRGKYLCRESDIPVLTVAL